MELTDGVVALRRPEERDVDWIVESCRDPENQRWLPGLPAPYERTDAQWWLGRAEAVWRDGSAAPFVIENVPDIEGAGEAERLGVIELRCGEPADTGYWLAPAGRGRGAMTRALVLVARYGFVKRGLASIELYTLKDNVRSQSVAERAGFRRTGQVVCRIKDRDGRSHDAWRFVLEAG